MTRSGTILLVEDDPNDVLLIRRALRNAMIANPLREVAVGDEAIAYLSGVDGYGDRDAHPLPALVLLDLKLPRRDGFEVLRWIRAQPGLRRLPVVVLTSSRETADVNRAYDEGANSYLVKPVAFDALLELVRRVDEFWLYLSETPELS